MARQPDTQSEQLVFDEDRTPEQFAGFEIDIETAETLIERGYLDPNERQNDSPTAEELISAARELATEYNADVRLGGYRVPPPRHDARHTLFEIKVIDAEDDAVREAFEQFSSAYEFTVFGDEFMCRALWD